MTAPLRCPLPAPLPDDDAARGARRLCEQLRAAGHVAWLAGGCVRDLLLGEIPKDYDVATDASVSAVKKLFPRTRLVGAAFGVCRVMGKGDLAWEVAQFRTESGYSDGRHPDHVAPGTPEQDARRRDFTINGLFLDPECSEVIDYVGGIADLREHQVLRAIGDPHERFGEDYLRMLRAVRFATRTGFRVDEQTHAAIAALAPKLAAISAERIAGELRLMLALPRAARACTLLIELGLIEAVLPGTLPAPAAALPAWRQRVVAQAAHAAASGWAGSDQPWLLPLAALVDTAAADPAPRSPLAARLADIEERLRLSRRELTSLQELLECRALLAADPASVPMPAAKRLCRRDGFAAALVLLEGDSHAAAPLAASWRSRRASWGACDLFPAPLLSAERLMELGVPRGPELGQTLRALEDAQLGGEVETPKQAEAWLQRPR